MTQSDLRRIPSVDRILSGLGETELPRPAVLAVVRRQLAGLRKERSVPDYETILERARETVSRLAAARIRPLINGTGILIHTNLGRAPLGPAAIETLVRSPRTTTAWNMTLSMALAGNAPLISSTILPCYAAPKPPQWSTTTPRHWF